MHCKLTLIDFGYTRHSNIRPASLSSLASALKEIQPDEPARVQVRCGSLHPEPDRLERPQKYTADLHPHTLGITGGSEVQH